MKRGYKMIGQYTHALNQNLKGILPVIPVKKVFPDIFFSRTYLVLLLLFLPGAWNFFKLMTQKLLFHYSFSFQ